MKISGYRIFGTESKPWPRSCKWTEIGIVGKSESTEPKVVQCFGGLDPRPIYRIGVSGSGICKRIVCRRRLFFALMGCSILLVGRCGLGLDLKLGVDTVIFADVAPFFGQTLRLLWRNNSRRYTRESV